MWGFETKNVPSILISKIKGSDEGFWVIFIIVHNTENVQKNLQLTYRILGPSKYLKTLTTVE